MLEDAIIRIVLSAPGAMEYGARDREWTGQFFVLLASLSVLKCGDFGFVRD